MPPIMSRSAGGISGTVTGSGKGSQGVAIWASSGNLSIAGDVSGTVSATDNTGNARALWASGNLNGGDTATPLLITGDVTANARFVAMAAQGGLVNLKVSQTGTLSAVYTEGLAFAVLSTGSGDDTVELVGGCTIVGDIDLGTGTGDTLILSGTTGTTTYAGDVSGVENVNATGGNWTLSGVVSGDAAVTKSGTGTLTLSGTNTYTGTNRRQRRNTKCRRG